MYGGSCRLSFFFAPRPRDGGRRDAARYDRAGLRAGDVLPGPAIVTEMDSTTLILPGHVATADRSGSLLIRPAGDAAQNDAATES